MYSACSRTGVYSHENVNEQQLRGKGPDLAEFTQRLMGNQGADRYRSVTGGGR